MIDQDKDRRKRYHVLIDCIDNMKEHVVGSINLSTCSFLHVDFLVDRPTWQK
jgi:hypothetical protein